MERKNLFILFFWGFIFILLSYFYLDKPLVFFLHEHNTRQYEYVMRFFSDYIIFVIMILIFIFYLFYYIKKAFNLNFILNEKLILLANATVIGQFVKEIFKGICGRYWTYTFRHSNPSLIRDNLYGFNWFKFDGNYASFPSGHTTFIVAFSTAAYVLFPKLRLLWISLILIVVFSQLFLYYHFLSDVIAGAIIGWIIGYYTSYTYKVANKKLIDI